VHKNAYVLKSDCVEPIELVGNWLIWFCTVFLWSDTLMVVPLWAETCSNVPCDMVKQISEEPYCEFCWFIVVN